MNVTTQKEAFVFAMGIGDVPLQFITIAVTALNNLNYSSSRHGRVLVPYNSTPKWGNILESTCFGRGRCLRENGEGGGAEGSSLSVYVHDETCSVRDSSEVMASFVGGDVRSRWSRAAGAFRQAAESSDKRLRPDNKAMFAEASMRPCYFRYGYDIAIPVPVKKVFHKPRDAASQDRKYFETFTVTALEVFDSNFGRDMDGTVHATLDILEERPSFRGRSR